MAKIVFNPSSKNGFEIKKSQPFRGEVIPQQLFFVEFCFFPCWSYELPSEVLLQYDNSIVHATIEWSWVSSDSKSEDMWELLNDLKKVENKHMFVTFFPGFLDLKEDWEVDIRIDCEDQS